LGLARRSGIDWALNFLLVSYLGRLSEYFLLEFGFSRERFLYSM
jgi:hypothetical protein